MSLALADVPALGSRLINPRPILDRRIYTSQHCEHRLFQKGRDTPERKMPALTCARAQVIDDQRHQREPSGSDH